MSTRTPQLQSRSGFHAYWGAYADAPSLPNAAGAPLAANQFFLEAGDVAYSIADGARYVCTSPGSATLGDAVWVQMGGGSSLTFRSLYGTWSPGSTYTITAGHRELVRVFLETGDLPDSSLTSRWSIRSIAAGDAPATIPDQIGANDFTRVGAPGTLFVRNTGFAGITQVEAV